MIKGIMALFTSGAILNPMVLSGIVLAVYCMVKLDAEQMRGLFGDYHLYALVTLVSFAYTFVFKKVYKDDGVNLDYASMILSAIGGIAKFVLASVLTVSFVIMLSF
ncbi:MAG: hypothetical protein IJ482_05650 [Alphaproteobacteria bacterium]|nr:hypothetical protein [Alphaproteobacteria bacterium]